MQVLKDADAVALACADLLEKEFRSAVSARGLFLLGLAGGRTPQATYRNLAKRKLEWNRVRFFFGDERGVPAVDPGSNYRMARETLLDSIRARPENVIRLEGEAGNLETAAQRAETALRAVMKEAGADGPDVVVLGVGEDGHTASLFPGSSALEEGKRWIIATSAPRGVQPSRRMTLTLPALAATRVVIVLCTGAAKRAALEASFGDDPPPAGQVHGAERTIWLVDEAAAGK
jgi:6-phosphogluconolactonase